MPACDDMYRYIWEGKILGLGFNPFQLSPDSPALAHFRDSNWALINHPNLPTLYPPVAEAIFALLARIHPTEWLFKSAFIAFDVASCLMLRLIILNHEAANAATRSRILAIYFLNPLLVLEIAGRGHFDSLPIFFNLVFFWSLQIEKAGSPIALALGALSKINSLALLPLLFFRLPIKRALAWSLALAALIFASFLATGMFHILGRFTTYFHYNSMVPFVIEKTLPFFPSVVQREIGWFLMAVCAAFLFVRLRHASLAQQALGFMGLLLVFSPTLHSWYLLWILPFAALTVSRFWLLLSGTIMITYLVYGRAYVTGQWLEIPWLRLPEFLPPIALWLFLKTKTQRPLA